MCFTFHSDAPSSRLEEKFMQFWQSSESSSFRKNWTVAAFNLKKV